MGSRLQDENNRILSALQEGQVQTVITLHENEMLTQSCVGHGVRRREIASILTDILGMSEDDANYWLNWYKVT